VTSIVSGNNRYTSICPALFQMVIHLHHLWVKSRSNLVMTVKQLIPFPIALVLLALGNITAPPTREKMPNMCIWLFSYWKTHKTIPMNWKGGRHECNIV